MTVATARPHTDAVATRLEAANLLVGRGEKPDGSGWQGEPGAADFVGYVVLWPSPGTTTGDLCDPHEYLDYQVRVTCVGGTQAGFEAIADRVKTALVGVRLTVPGRSLYPFQVVEASPPLRDDALDPPIHYGVLRLSCRSGPA